MSEGNKLQQCAEILLCFCLDFSAHRAAQITYHRYRLVAEYYDHFRTLLTEMSLSEEKMKLLSEHKGDIQVIHDRSRCRWCQSKIRGVVKENPPVFSVQCGSSGTVTIDPLNDDEAAMFGSQKEHSDASRGYVGFICCGKFHRFAGIGGLKDSAEKQWAWILERVHARYGIWKHNTGYYLKELEWKYNNRSLDPDLQAQKIIGFMPADFLTAWLDKEAIEGT